MQHCQDPNMIKIGFNQTNKEA